MQLTVNAEQIWMSSNPVDFRRSIDGLCAYISDEMRGKPQQGIYLFFNKSKDRVKIIAWHKNGFVMIYKRLERGKFTVFASDSSGVKITAKQLSWLLAGLDWVTMSDWNELDFDEFY
jgi:transposase